MPSSSFLFLFCFLSFFYVSLSHNWVGSPRRAFQAAVTKPCQARVDFQPHIQVGVNQTFEMSWSLGHGDSNTVFMYWVAVHEDDFDKLLDFTPALIDDYLKNAPSWSIKNGTKWDKRHLLWDSDGFFYGYFNSTTPVSNTSSAFVPLDPVMIGKSLDKIPRKQYLFADNQTRFDKRASYFNPKYPWIQAADKFKNVFQESNVFAHQYDFASFALEGRKGPGNYIYHYYWGGYRDCVDIHIHPEKKVIQNRYGLPTNRDNTTFVKMDHCEFTYIENPTFKCQLVPKVTKSAKQCLDLCKSQPSCKGVQAVRITNPSITLPYSVNIPSVIFNFTQSDRFVNNVGFLPYSGPCGYHSVRERLRMGCNVKQTMCDVSQIAGAQPDDYLCFGVNPYRHQDFQTVEDYELASDATDPKFYSTCWMKVSEQGFIDINRPVKNPPQWVAGDYCIDCKFRKYAHSLNDTIVINWSEGITKNCQHCDLPY